MVIPDKYGLINNGLSYYLKSSSGDMLYFVDRGTYDVGSGFKDGIRIVLTLNDGLYVSENNGENDGSSYEDAWKLK